MCGIAGIVGRVGDANREALARMNAAMAHRGPDAEGTFEAVNGPDGRGLLLAHRRLAILDLSPAGAQPMTDPVTGDVIVYNGEIYNYPELRTRLEAAGQHFQSTGDTAVMLRALGVEGREALPSFRGMFAFAHWSPARRELLLARDPLGMKPLYLARNPDPAGSWSLVFASEVRALLASGLLGQPRLDPVAAASVVWNGFVVGPGTAIQGVESLWPGEWRTFDAWGRPLESRRYWTLPRPSAAARPMDEDELAHVMEKGLRLHLASDVPLAVFLSGGVDSSAVANLAQRAAATPIHTFTLAFEEEEYNEGHAARQIAAAIGTEHTEVVLREAEFVAGLDAALDSLDQPTIDGINSYVMSRAIRRAGFTVALAGTGGDELFGGYASFRDLPVLRRWLRRMRWIPGAARAAVARLGVSALLRSSGPVAPQTRWAKLPAMVRSADLLSLYQLAYALFLPDFQARLLGTADLMPDGLPPTACSALREEAGGRSPLASISAMEQRLFLGDRLLRDNDAASMAPSVEQRLPLVDQVLTEAVYRLPDAVRYEPVGQKAILRRIGLRGLDPALFDRPKRGFVLPYDRWIRVGLQPVMDRALRDPAAVRAAGLEPEPVAALWQAFLDRTPGLYWSRVWALFVLVRWCERHGVRR